MVVKLGKSPESVRKFNDIFILHRKCSYYYKYLMLNIHKNFYTKNLIHNRSF